MMARLRWGMRRHEARVPAVVRLSGWLAAVLACFGFWVAASARAIVLPTYDGAPYHGTGLQQKPYVITWTGDGTGVLGGRGRAAVRYRVGRLHWTTWTKTLGRAWGANWLDDCNPNCAEGVHTPFAVNVTADRPKYEFGYRIFTRMTITYTKSIPRGVHGRTQHLNVVHSSGGFYWNFNAL